MSTAKTTLQGKVGSSAAAGIGKGLRDAFAVDLSMDAQMRSLIHQLDLKTGGKDGGDKGPPEPAA